MGLEGAEWQQEEDIRVRLGLRLRLRKFSVVSHCGKSLKVRAVRDNRPYQAGSLGNYGKEEAVTKKNYKKSLTGSLGSILFPSP